MRGHKLSQSATSTQTEQLPFPLTLHSFAQRDRLEVHSKKGNLFKSNTDKALILVTINQKLNNLKQSLCYLRNSEFNITLEMLLKIFSLLKKLF